MSGYIFFFIICFYPAIILYFFLFKNLDFWKKNRPLQKSHHFNTTKMENTATPQRLLALDVFRGLTIALMFIVNTPGTWSFIYPPLEHAKWHGWTPTDFVFPFFLFTVGVAAWFSLKKYAGRPPSSLYFKILKRGFMIFLIGLALNAFLNRSSSVEAYRIMGVLQRIGIAYCLGSLICVSLPRTATAVVGVLILLGYWLMLYLTGDPNNLYGNFDLDTHKYVGIENLLVTQFDLATLGASHLYKGYGGIPFDPEGLLSTLPSIATVIIGYFVGWFVDNRPDRRRLSRDLVLLGVAALAIGWAWHFVFPINKPIWSSSYVVFMAGWCMVFNGLLIWLIDVQNWQGWTKPFVVMGMNSLLAFVISGAYVKIVSQIKVESRYETVVEKWNNNATVPLKIGGTQAIYENVFSRLTTPDAMMSDYKAKKLTKKDTPSVFEDFSSRQKLSSFLYALAHCVLFWFILWIFYKRNIFLKV